MGFFRAPVYALEMFLERKFSQRSGVSEINDPPLSPVLPHADWSSFPELVYDVLSNIQLLLKARRGYDHILPDYGLSPSEGRFGHEGLIERLSVELPQTLRRYEPRFTLLETDVEETDGKRFMRATGTIRGLAGRFSFRFGILSRKVDSLDFEPATSEPRG